MTTNPVRDWELERYLLGELPSRRFREIENLLQADLRLQERLAELRRSGETILQQYPPEEMLPRIEHRAEEERMKQEKRSKPVLSRRLLLAAPVLAAALVVLFVVLHNPDRGLDLPFPYGTRVKGIKNIDRSKPHLLIYRKIADDAELLEEGDTVTPGDLLQIAYGAAGKNYGVILSLDGKSVVTLHYPERETDSALLGDQKVVLLSSAYELDEAPDFERFFFITSQSEIDIPAILDAARKLATSPSSAQKENLAIAGIHSQYSLLLKKGDPL